MKVNKEFEAYQNPKEVHDVERLDNYDPANDADKASRRMANICANPAEIELYRWNPNGARNNRHPGIPGDDNEEEY